MRTKVTLLLSPPTAWWSQPLALACFWCHRTFLAQIHEWKPLVMCLSFSSHGFCVLESSEAFVDLAVYLWLEWWWLQYGKKEASLQPWWNLQNVRVESRPGLVTCLCFSCFVLFTPDRVSLFSFGACLETSFCRPGGH